MSKYDAAGRQIAGLLGYNPGPGIYSRLERAVQQMPENVRVQELPGLLKRYKDGVPGWELKATNLDEVIAGREVVPREELLARVREASPVYTHREVVLGGRPATETFRGFVAIPGRGGLTGAGIATRPNYQQSPSALGRGVSHGEAAFKRYGQGGSNYGELIFLSPEARRSGWGEQVHHFHQDYPAMSRVSLSPEVRSGLSHEGVAHARFDEHDGALRINEIQSDLGIHNRKAREAAQSTKGPPEQLPSETDGAYEERLRAAGFDVEWDRDGGMAISKPDLSIPFALDGAEADMLVKRLALYAAQNNLRRIEIASAESIADRLHMDLERAQHVYDKLLPGKLERLGRRTGGLTELPPARSSGPIQGSPYNVMEAEYKQRDLFDDIVASADRYNGPSEHQESSFYAVEAMVDAMRAGENPIPHAERLRSHMVRQAVLNGWPADVAESIVARDMPEIMRMSEDWLQARQRKDAVAAAASEYVDPPIGPPAPGRSYEMSDEMYRRIIEQGIGAALMAPIATEPVNGQTR